MAGLVSVLNIAKDALGVQQYAMEVASHNIANVDTAGYSKQRTVLAAKQPVPYANLLFGTGVSMEKIVRMVDGFVEARVLDRGTELAAAREKEIHMSVLEGLFNETTDRGLAAQFSVFWNAWHDLSNNPSGPAERNVLLEAGSRLAQGFHDLSVEMTQIVNEINLALQAGITRVNELTSRLAALNGQIMQMQTVGNANDLLDLRARLLTDLAEYLDIRSFEHQDGGITVMTKSGFVLVDKVHAYGVTLEDNEVKWEGSFGNWIAITDTLRGGKLGGWLDMRDAVIPKVQADLNELAMSTIWEVNKIHTQGVGLQLYGPAQTVTSTYQTAGTLGDLPFGDRIDFSGSFTLWIGDGNGENLQAVTLDLAGLGMDGTSTLEALRDAVNLRIDDEGLAGAVSAEVSANRLVFSADPFHTFGFSGDTASILAALGGNTFFTGSGAAGMQVNPVLLSDPAMIGAARLDPTTGETGRGDGSNALVMSDLQYLGVSVGRWTFERGSPPAYAEVADVSLEDYYHTLVSAVGLQSRSIQTAREYHEVIANQLRETRDSISAVSLDEEMANMIKYQHAFLAAAKLISAADDMLRALIEAK
jgi:flagellar hook-associated protein 1